MRLPRSLAAAALCALPLAAAACGGSGGSSSGGDGEELYRQYACASCHSLDGSKGTGPTFKGLAGTARGAPAGAPACGGGERQCAQRGGGEAAGKAHERRESTKGG